MREILFRGREVKSGNWVNGFYMKHINRTPCVVGDSVKNKDVEHIILFDAFSDWNMPRGIDYVHVDPSTIGQYTGMKDRNGKMIFEGDIISARLDEVFPEDETLVFVEWIDDRWAVRYINSPDGDYDDFDFFDTFTIDGFTIVGNIHDNPELLSVVKTDA